MSGEDDTRDDGAPPTVKVGAVDPGQAAPAGVLRKSREVDPTEETDQNTLMQRLHDSGLLQDGARTVQLPKIEPDTTPSQTSFSPEDMPTPASGVTPELLQAIADEESPPTLNVTMVPVGNLQGANLSANIVFAAQVGDDYTLSIPPMHRGKLAPGTRLLAVLAVLDE